MRFTLDAPLSVRTPYRLDLTVDALRRLAANVVDVVSPVGAYRRVVSDERGTNLLDVRQTSGRALRLRITGNEPERWVTVAERMLGTSVGLAEWYRRVKPYPWLAGLALELRGVHPPRYPTLWEALAHAIVFQQISIYAASSIMRRCIEAIGERFVVDGTPYYPFFTAECLLGVSEGTLRSAGLSGNKVAHLRSAADAVLRGAISEAQIAALPSAAAAQQLCEVRGIGPWSAAVVLLRGLGRLDVIPLKDSGVARSLKLLSGDPRLDAAALLEALGPVRGMLYFHLLLGSMRNLLPAADDSG